MRQVAPETSRPWRIIETTWTSDGPRTRVCDGAYADEVEATSALRTKEEEEAKR